MILVIPLLVQDFTVLEIIQPPSMQSSNINVPKKSLSPYKERDVEFWQIRGTAEGKEIIFKVVYNKFIKIVSGKRDS